MLLHWMKYAEVIKVVLNDNIKLYEEPLENIFYFACSHLKCA